MTSCGRPTSVAKTVLLVASVVLAAFSLAACGGSTQAAPGPDTVATVSGKPISLGEVRALLVDKPLPPVRIAGRKNVTPLRAATDRAIRDELLAREAAHRGIEGRTRAEQIAKLVDQEKQKNDNLTVASIEDHEARSWYQARISEIGRVAEAEVTWAKITSGEVADGLLGRVANSDPETFLRLVREAGAADSGTATIHGDGEHSVDSMVVRAAFSTAFTGGVGLAEEPRTKTWWLVRVGGIVFEEVKWDTTKTHQVKSTMATRLENEHLQRLADSLQQRWPVEVYEGRLAENDI